ncbi:uncharacterized protein A1O5_05640 [Cladophialophora psammophila CBS 110553]|uniref:Major facilitator superfamily (MFS) profile domain-containing protein n=1 Tax=Cladophialophora psammophila CBS 110553 TaxID=1182543 RepID=W9WZZ8_9EURO|nr:uncharacterized protein A1O5_05640 [Cladophialophora psammophila CBS 110553]EXJ70650.1 hypothetical protein A1O5_05640 [Cladophialophora psammophila CBS 110553]
MIAYVTRRALQLSSFLNRMQQTPMTLWSNWTYAKRIMAFYPILFLSTICHFGISGLAPGFEQIVLEFHVGPDKLSWLISICMLGSFIGCYTLALLTDRFGRRPIWLFAALWVFLCSIWGAVSDSYTSLLLSRFFASWAAGVSEPVSVTTTNDLFFLHERGTQCGVQSVWLSLGASLSPVITGFLIQSKGWRWYKWVLSILAGFDLLWIFFCSPETRYRRNLHESVDVAGADEFSDKSAGTRQSLNEIAVSYEEKTTLETSASHQSAIDAPVRKRSYLLELKPWSPVDKDVNVLAAFFRAWATWSYLSIAWAVTSWAIHVSCVIVLISLIPIYLGATPYNFTTSQQGLTFLAACVGNILGSFLCGYMTDKLSQWSARRNNGVFEPEMRLPVVIFPAVAVPVGLLMFGIGLEKKFHWIVPVIGSGLVGTGLTGIAAIVEAYMMDSYAPVLADGIVNLYGFKSIVSFAIGFAVVPWLKLNGIIPVFCILSAMVIVVDAFAMVIYIWGKRLRERDARLRVLAF